MLQIILNMRVVDIKFTRLITHTYTKMQNTLGSLVVIQFHQAGDQSSIPRLSVNFIILSADCIVACLPQDVGTINNSSRKKC